MATDTATTSTDDEPELKRHIGIVGLLFASVGSIIGSGWLFGALNASKEAGPAAVISWALGAVMVLAIALVYAELGVMFPLSGGVIRYPHLAFGSFASYTAGWITWVGGQHDGADRGPGVAPVRHEVRPLHGRAADRRPDRAHPDHLWATRPPSS